MTGKTTMLDAVFWALYGYLPKWGGPKGGSADAVIKRGTKHCVVCVSVEHGGDIYQIVRRRPTCLSVVKNQGDIPGKKNDLDTRIPELIGMTADQFLLSVYISQDRTTSFFTMTDIERTKLLSTIAGLESLNKALDKAKGIRDDVQIKIKVEQGAIGAIEGHLARFPSERASLQAEAEPIERLLAASHERLALATREAAERHRVAEGGAVQQIASVDADIKATLERLSQEFTAASYEKGIKIQDLLRSPKLDPSYSVAVAQAQASLEAAQELNLQRAKQGVTNAQARAALSQIAEKLKSGTGLAGFCEECDQALPVEDREAQMHKLLDKATYWEGLLKPEEPQAHLTPLKEALSSAQMALAQMNAQLAAKPDQLRVEVRALETRLVQIKREAELEEANSRSKKISIQSVADGINRSANDGIIAVQRELDLLTSKRVQVESALKGITQRECQVAGDLEQNKAKLSVLLVQLDEALDLIDLFGPKGFRAVCFDGIIERISDRAGELLSLMTDNVYATRIEQCAENSKGEDKVVLRPVITKGGLEVPLDDLSGGARKMAMLAYDVAVSESVGDSSILFLDEALDGLDAQGKGEAMRLLEEVARHRAVLLIDHTSEIRAACQSVIQVKYKDGTSFIEGPTIPEEAAQ